MGYKKNRSGFTGILAGRKENPELRTGLGWEKGVMQTRPEKFLRRDFWQCLFR